MAKEIIADQNNEILFSVASAWEIAIKFSINKLTLPTHPEEYIISRLESNNFQILTIQLSHVIKVADLPQHHKDPFDRLIIAQSIMEKIPVISTDMKIDPYGVNRAW
jgi:PIN domain nuclease of toxin-antitoxin system